jgi:tRNA(Ile)-lysidine synthase
MRFGIEPRPSITLAHFDHAMRPDSAADAAWLRGVARAWDVEYRGARAASPPASEDEARRARYDFLEEVRVGEGSGWILTAHHADDQAETVLFRVLRGTGLEGLRGMEPLRRPAVVRPLLDLWREDLEAYARAVGLRWREDPTNRIAGYARNVIRHEILPKAEASVAPGARRALVRLAGLARQDEEAWAEVMPGLLRRLGADENGVAWDAAAALGPALRARVIRHLAAGAGAVLDAAATARAVDFAGDARSGHGIQLGGGLMLRRELDRLVVVPEPHPPDDDPLEIPDAGPGRGTARLGGRDVRIRWSPGPARSDVGGRRVELPLRDLRFPLTVRGRRPGDRIEVWGGSRRVKRLLQDAKVPSLRRPAVPVVSDASGRILWVAGVAEFEGADPDGGDTMTICAEDEG